MPPCLRTSLPSPALLSLFYFRFIDLASLFTSCGLLCRRSCYNKDGPCTGSQSNCFCSSKNIHSVAAIDIAYNAFHELVNDITPVCTESDSTYATFICSLLIIVSYSPIPATPFFFLSLLRSPQSFTMIIYMTYNSGAVLLLIRRHSWSMIRTFTMPQRVQHGKLFLIAVHLRLCVRLAFTSYVLGRGGCGRYSTSFTHQLFFDSLYERVSLARRDGSIMRRLIERGLFSPVEHLDFQVRLSDGHQLHCIGRNLAWIRENNDV